MPLHWLAWDRMAKDHGVELTQERFLALAGKPAPEILALLCKEQGKTIDIEKALHEKHEYYNKELMPKLTRIQCVIDIAEHANKLGIPCAVASGGSRAHVTAGLKNTGIEHLFKAVVTCEDTPGRGKPLPDVFLIAAERIGVPARYCVGYEDAQLGLEAICRGNFLAAVNVCMMDGYPPFERHDED